MRSSGQRTGKYAAKLSGEITKQRLDFYRKTQTSNFRETAGRQVAIEQQVKAAMEQMGVSPLYTNYYMLFAKNMGGKSQQERDAEYMKWYQRGLRHDWLRWIGHTIARARLDTTGPGIRQDCVAYWPFYEGSGTAAADASGYANNGTITAAAWRPGVIGKELYFDGVNAKVVCGAGLSVTTGTLMAWCTPESAGGATTYKAIVSKGSYASANEWLFYIGRDTRMLGAASGGAKIANDNRALTYGARYHVAAVFDGTNAYFFVNGERGPSSAFAGGLDANAKAIRIGDDESATRNFKGAIDEVRLFGRVLSDDEVRRIYESERLV